MKSSVLTTKEVDKQVRKMLETGVPPRTALTELLEYLKKEKEKP